MIDLSVLLQELFETNRKPDMVRPVSGGDINEAYLVGLKDGRRKPCRLVSYPFQADQGRNVGTVLTRFDQVT